MVPIRAETRGLLSRAALVLPGLTTSRVIVAFSLIDAAYLIRVIAPPHGSGWVPVSLPRLSF